MLRAPHVEVRSTPSPQLATELAAAEERRLQARKAGLSAETLAAQQARVEASIQVPPPPYGS